MTAPDIPPFVARVIDDLHARLAAAEARAEELAAIVESQRVMLAAADRYRALLDLETWMARAERAEADARFWRTLADDAIQLLVFADAHVSDELETHHEALRLCQRYDAAVAERPQP